MFCPNCGAQLPEGSAFCGNCGTKMNAAPEAAPVAAPVAEPQPTYAPQPSYEPQPTTYAPVGGVPTKPMKKSEYLKTQASPAAKKNSMLVLITTLVAIVLMVAGIVSALTVPFFEIPFIAFAADAAGEDADELMDELEDDFDRTEEEYEMYEDTYSKSEQEAAEALLEVMEKFCDNPSILNLQSMVDVYLDVAEDAPSVSEDDIDEMEEIATLMDAIVLAIIAFYLLPLLFTLLGGLNKSTGLTVTGIVFTVFSQAIFGGVLLVALNVAVGVFQAVLCSKIGKEYKTYKNKCIYGY